MVLDSCVSPDFDLLRPLICHEADPNAPFVLSEALLEVKSIRRATGREIGRADMPRAVLGSAPSHFCIMSCTNSLSGIAKLEL